MRRWLLGAAFLGGAAVADISMVGTKHNVTVLYLDGDRLTYAYCAKGVEAPTDRHCARGTDQPYTTELTGYQRRLMMLYHVWPEYTGKDGLSRISVRIERLSRELADSELTESEKAKLSAAIAKSKEQQASMLKVKSDILAFLVEGKDKAVDAEYNSQYYRLLDAFYPLWYDGISLVWSIGEVVNWRDSETIWFRQESEVAKRACRHGWRPARPNDMLARVGDRRLIEILGESDLKEAIAGQSVWLTGVLVAQLGSRIQHGEPNLNDPGLSLSMLGMFRTLCVRE